MKFVDSINIEVIAGNGGDGYIRVQKKEKQDKLSYKLHGSNGGDGGDIWLLADCNLNNLNYFYSHRVFRANHGHSGQSKGCTGKKGKDLWIKVPWGTRVSCQKKYNLLGDMGYTQSCLKVAKGGRHGIGSNSYNFYMNQKMRKRRYAGVGETRNLLLELFLTADVGVIGLPNSGKSSFIRSISNAKPKVSDYPFTTLEPSLGSVVVDNDVFIITDIPGIIKGSAYGEGLGVSFLRHLERCCILLHFVDIDPIDNSDLVQNIITVESELNNFNSKLMDKPRWLIFNKVDLLGMNKSEKKIDYVIQSLCWKDRYYSVSSIYKVNVFSLCRDIMEFIVCKRYLNRHI